MPRYICHACQRSFYGDTRHGRKAGKRYCSLQCFRPNSFLPLAERFWSFVLKTETCWLWQSYRNDQGYGQYRIKDSGRKIYAHRLAYELTYGLILPGLFCCHHCDTPHCVRPGHLFLGTQRDNMRDMMNKQRNMHVVCPELLARGERHGRRLHPERYPRGEQQFLAKLTETRVQEIRAMYANNQGGYRTLARIFGVSPTLIRYIVLRKIWTHVA